jgi:hypothetical protein
MIDEALTPASSRSLLVGLNQRVPDLPAIASHVIMQMRVEWERRLADGTPIRRPSWEDPPAV